MAKIDQVVDIWREQGLVNWAQSPHGWIGEDGNPLVLADWQMAVIAGYEERREDVSTVLISTVKKAGKTLLNSLWTCYRWLTIPSIHYVINNDKDQSQELQFRVISKMVERHPILSSRCKINTDKIIFLPTGSELTALSQDFAGNAGANFATVSYSEIWGYTHESSVRLWEELTPLPLVDCVRIVDSYAGFDGESDLLERVWNRAINGEQVNSEWPLYNDGGLLGYIHTGEDAQRRCWRGNEEQRAAYYTEQKNSLRETAYRRLHLNEWGASTESFVTTEQVAAITDPVLKPLRLDATSDYDPDYSSIIISVDLATKSDHAAVAGIRYNDSAERLELAFHEVWTPPRVGEINLSDIENRILERCNVHNVDYILYDPYQAAYLMQRLRAAGLRCVEFTQTEDNLCRATVALHDAIKNKTLAIYDSKRVARYLTSAAIKHNNKGYRLVKRDARSKIDLAVVLAWAVLGYEDQPRVTFGRMDISEFL